MKACGVSGGIAPRIPTSALDGGEWSTSCPGRFTPRERAPGTHRTGGWVGPRIGLDAVAKKKKSLHCLFRDSNPSRQVRGLVTGLNELPRLQNSF
jgi:hypothetical protein